MLHIHYHNIQKGEIDLPQSEFSSQNPGLLIFKCLPWSIIEFEGFPLNWLQALGIYPPILGSSGSSSRYAQFCEVSVLLRQGVEELGCMNLEAGLSYGLDFS